MEVDSHNFPLHTLTTLASEARSSTFVSELMKDSSYGVAGPGEAVARTQICGECVGRLLYMRGQDGRAWYRCEHGDLCGNRLPSCATCGDVLPRPVAGRSGLVCVTCETASQPCPKCRDGWLVERSGKFGAFLGCVRFPECDGKGKIAARPKAAPQDPSG